MYKIHTTDIREKIKNVTASYQPLALSSLSNSHDATRKRPPETCKARGHHHNRNLKDPITYNIHGITANKQPSGKLVIKVPAGEASKTIRGFVIRRWHSIYINKLIQPRELS